MSTDSWGNAITATRPAHVSAITGFTHGLLSYEQTLLPVLTEAEQDVSDTLLHAYAAVLWLLSESPKGAGEARTFVQRARLGVRDALPREAAFLEFVAAWADGDLDRAFQLSDGLIAQWPRDLTAIKLRQYLDFNLGRFSELLRVGLIAQKAVPEIAYVHGMAAFGYEQCHLMDEAETAARQALDILPTDPWAQHALAHVMLTEGRIDEGVQFLESVSAHWDGLNSFMYTHLWWHLALFRLSQGHLDEALDLYDRHVWGVDTTYSQDQVGAVSLLARLELAGAEVGDRWAAMADHLAGRAGDVVEPFLSLQYLHGLLRARRPQAQELLAAIAARAESAVGPAQSAWRDCAQPLALGLAALADDRPEDALRHFRQGLPYLAAIGGSHAQRDLFEQFELQALLDSHAWSEAQQVLEKRRGFDPYGVPLNRQLADVYVHLGLPELAETARQRIERRRVHQDTGL